MLTRWHIVSQFFSSHYHNVIKILNICLLFCSYNVTFIIFHFDSVKASFFCKYVFPCFNIFNSYLLFSGIVCYFRYFYVSVIYWENYLINFLIHLYFWKMHANINIFNIDNIIFNNVSGLMHRRPCMKKVYWKQLCRLIQQSV